jgi:alkylation response protein AidB-like acyl-CoA dehydrogenase
MIPGLTALTAEQREIQQAARDFAQAEIAPYTAQWDRDAYFEPTLVQKLGELGFLGMQVPEIFDGLGLDTLTYLVALEEIAVVDASVAVMISVHNSLPTQMILRWGSDVQKERYLRPMARGEMLGAFALSEPDAGSDAAALSVQAVRDGDCWVLNGTKAWVSSGTHADVILAMARTDRPDHRRGPRGISAFIVTPDMLGFRVGKKEDKMGLRASPTVQLVFDGLRVPSFARAIPPRRTSGGAGTDGTWDRQGPPEEPRESKGTYRAQSGPPEREAPSGDSYQASSRYRSPRPCRRPP